MKYLLRSVSAVKRAGWERQGRNIFPQQQIAHLLQGSISHTTLL